jgi:methyl-accepting chemotaxis protein
MPPAPGGHFFSAILFSSRFRLSHASIFRHPDVNAAVRRIARTSSKSTHMNIADLRIGTRLGAGFALLLVLMTLLTGVGLWLLRDYGASTDLILNDAIAKERLVNEWLAATELNGMRSAALLAEAEPAARQETEALIKETSGRISTIQQQLDKLVTSTTGRALLAKTQDGRNAYASARAAAFASTANGDADANMEKGRAMRAGLKTYLASIHELATHQRGKATHTAQQMETQGQTGQLVLGALWLVSTFIAIAWTVLVARSITRPLQRAIGVAQAVAQGNLSSIDEACSRDETGQLLAALNRMNGDLFRIVGSVRDSSSAIASASAQIASGNENLSARTEQQAGALEETASSMEELTSAVRQNADHARQASVLTNAASSIAVKGQEVMTEVEHRMGTINESARKITDIIGVIDALAFQTNLLALNAAVEAARAGEQGRGFAVVASEVRNLAHRSAGAAKEIKALIETSVREVDTGSELVARAGATMQEIVSSVGRVTGIVQEISLASSEQQSGIEQINQAISQMDAMTQQNAALVEEAAAASDALRLQACGMEEVVGVFTLQETAARAGATRRGAPAGRVPHAALALR